MKLFGSWGCRSKRGPNSKVLSSRSLGSCAHLVNGLFNLKETRFKSTKALLIPCVKGFELILKETKLSIGFSHVLVHLCKVFSLTTEVRLCGYESRAETKPISVCIIICTVQDLVRWRPRGSLALPARRLSRSRCISSRARLFLGVDARVAAGVCH